MGTAYYPTGTNITDYTSTALKPGDTIIGQYLGYSNPITVPAGVYKLECQGGAGGRGYYASLTSSTATSYTTITSSNYTSYFSVSNSTYYFTPNTSGYWRASNLGVNSSTAQTVWTCSNAGTYVITYYYLTETNYDKFTLTIGGSTYVSAASGGAASNSYTVSLSSGSTIVATYAKDSSQHATNEDVYITIQKQETNTTYTPNSRTNAGYGGYGGYSSGVLVLKEPTTLYLYAGGRGEYSSSATRGTTTSGGFNGGGTGVTRYWTSAYSSGGGGGGASDIRIGTDSLYARVIVAGGGGGNGGDSSCTGTLLAGGGETSNAGLAEYAASQTAAGTNGSFGQGANSTSGNNYNYGPGGGGGGWYGGGGNVYNDGTTAYRTYCGGGSGYVYTADTAANYPSGCLLNSNYYLFNASTITGNTWAAISGSSNYYGYVKITVLPTIFIKTDSETWNPISNVYIKTTTDTWKGGSLLDGYDI